MVIEMVINGEGVVLLPSAPAGDDGGGSADMTFLVQEGASDDRLGTIDLSHIVGDRGQAEITLRLRPQVAKSPTPVAAVAALANWAFDNGFARLELLAAMEDSNSVRLALSAGFQNEGVRRGAGSAAGGERGDLVAFARLAGDPVGPISRILPDLPGGGLTDGMIDLRPLRASDAEDYFRLHSLPEVAQYYVGPTMTPQVAAVRCAQADYRWVTGEMAQCAIVDIATGQFAGDIQLINRGLSPATVMLGYSLTPQARGKGFATRAVNLLSDWAFQIGSVRVIAGTYPDNDRSRAVLVRAGFSYEATLRCSLPGSGSSRIDNIQYVRISPMAGTGAPPVY
jgi:RimJ/RimL family protein N-acetyltransferase